MIIPFLPRPLYYKGVTCVGLWSLTLLSATLDYNYSINILKYYYIIISVLYTSKSSTEETFSISNT